MVLNLKLLKSVSFITVFHTRINTIIISLFFTFCFIIFVSIVRLPISVDVMKGQAYRVQFLSVQHAYFTIFSGRNVAISGKTVTKITISTMMIKNGMIDLRIMPIFSSEMP